MNEPQNLRPKSVSHKLTPFLVFATLVLIALLGWCWWRHSSGGSGSYTSPGDSIASGPCEKGAANTAPAGYVFYENATLGYRFAYPSAWGSVSVTTTPIASESGNYVMGRFSTNDAVWFGGNATDYVARGRDGIPTDLPGYLKASGKYYLVELWSFNDGSTVTPRDDLHPVEPPATERKGCNATALMTQLDASELSSVGPATIARFNLKPTSNYYGVNFVIDKPSTAASAQFDNLVKTFELY